MLLNGRPRTISFNDFLPYWPICSNVGGLDQHMVQELVTLQGNKPLIHIFALHSFRFSLGRSLTSYAVTYHQMHRFLIQTVLVFKYTEVLFQGEIMGS